MQRSRPPILAATRQLTNLTVPIGSRVTCFNPDGSYQVSSPRDGGQWTRHVHKLPGCQRTRPRRTPPDKPARAGSPTTIPAVNIAIWGRWLTAPRMPPERPNTMEEKSLPNHRRLPVGMGANPIRLRSRS